MKNSALTASEKVCAYSAAVIADAQASIIRATESVQHAGNTITQVRKQRRRPPAPSLDSYTAKDHR